MGLTSVTQTALSGINAANLQIQVAAQNLANAQTTAYKAASVSLATQPNFGGVTVAAVVSDFSQGSIEVEDGLPLLALEGEGLFILEGDDGQRLYSRDGRFAMNAEGELVNSLGRRLLGFAINEHGVLDRTQLSPLKVRLGSTVETADGATAKLIGYSIHRDGRLVGRYTDGVQRTLGQVRVARFNNPHGLEQRAGNLYRATHASGLPLETDADTDGAAAIVSGGLECSNVDIGAEIIQLALARMQFRASLAVLDTTNAMHDELMEIGRLRRPR